MRVLIRTDASTAIGLGHLRRCLSLADALRTHGAQVRFGLGASDVPATAMVRAEGFDAAELALPDLGDRPAQSDAEAFAALSPDGTDWVLVDHYRLDASWHAEVRARLNCRIAVIDDLADRPLDADVLIDHNYVPSPGHRVRYRARMRREPQAWLCGPRFALLGPSYRARTPMQVSQQVRSIGIFLGGTDPAELSATALRACREGGGFTGPVEVASTSANPNLESLRRSVAADPQASLLLDQPDLADFFARHDLQIGAGGGAAWERCCIGVPALTLCVADNQRAVIPALAELGALSSAVDNSLEAIGQALRPLLEDHARRQSLASQGRALVDGRGAERVALALAARAPEALTLQSATLADAQLLWRWRDAPVTRAVSRAAEPIAWSDHLTWLARTLGDAARRLWLARIGPTPIGVIRFDSMGENRHEVSLYLDPGLHGLGLGTALLDAGERYLVDQVGPAQVEAEVLTGNQTSYRLFLAAGYSNTAPNHFSKTVAPAAGTPAGRQEFSS